MNCFGRKGGTIVRIGVMESTKDGRGHCSYWSGVEAEVFRTSGLAPRGGFVY